MMVRRIVTGHRAGKSVILSDGPVANTHDYAAIKGFRTTSVWATPGSPRLPHDEVDPATVASSVVPGPGGSSLLIVTFPPDTVMMVADFDGVAAAAEYLRYLPGLAESFEPANPGMHTTATIDYDIVLDGEIWLELDDCAEVRLSRHDVAVQNGTRHAWRNKSDKPATLAFVLIGAGS